MFINFKTGINNSSQFTYFNALKIIGAIIIAFFLHFQDHFLLYLSEKNPFTGIFYFLSIEGHCFVEMFFVLSGILFSFVYQPKIIQGLSFKAFIKKRSLRLFPPTVFTTLTAYGFISVLMVCYILGFVFTKYKSSVLFFLAIFIGACIQYFKLNYPFLNIDIARGLLSFFTGVTIKPLFEIISSFKKNEKIVFRIFIIFLMMICFSVYQKNSLYFSPTFFTLFFFFTPLIICLYDLKCLNKLCNTKFVKWLGDISFDIYLWNFPIYMLLHLLIIKGCFQPLNIWFLWILAIIIHFAVATLSHKINNLIRHK